MFFNQIVLCSKIYNADMAWNILYKTLDIRIYYADVFLMQHSIIEMMIF